MLLQLIARADTRDLQQLRRVERASAEDHLAPSAGDLGGRQARIRRCARVGPVEARPFTIFDTGRAAVLDHDLRHQRLLAQLQRAVRAIHRVDDPLACAVAAPVGHRDRNEDHALG